MSKRWSRPAVPLAQYREETFSARRPAGPNARPEYRRPADDAHRRRRARRPARRPTPAMCILPGMLYARVLRSPHPHARIRSIDVSKALALPGVKAIISHENCTFVVGRRSIAGGAQYNEEIKKITKQRRYAFNNPVRFVGEPVAAVAAVDRHTAEEALQLIAVDYEVLPFVLDPEEALKPGAPQIWPEGNLSPNARNEAMPIGTKRGNVEEGFTGVRSRVRGSLLDLVRPQRADGAARLRRGLGGRQADGLHADRRHRQLPHRHGARSRHPAGKCPRRLPVHGRQLRQQEPESGRRPDRGDAGEESRRAGEAGALAQGRLHRRARPLADRAVLQGRRQERRHAAGDPVARLQRHGAVSQEHRRHRRRRALSVPEHRDARLAGLHQPDGVGELPRSGVSAGLLRHPVDDGRRRARS